MALVVKICLPAVTKTHTKWRQSNNVWRKVSFFQHRWEISLSQSPQFSSHFAKQESPIRQSVRENHCFKKEEIEWNQSRNKSIVPVSGGNI